METCRDPLQALRAAVGLSSAVGAAKADTELSHVHETYQRILAQLQHNVEQERARMEAQFHRELEEQVRRLPYLRVA
jgi:hypothetical protein